MKAVFTKLVNFKASPAQHESWQNAAHEARMSFGKWARMQLDKGLSESQGPVLPTKTYEREVSKPLVEKTTALAQELIERAKTSQKTKCERRLPKGTFCKGCGKIH